MADKPIIFSAPMVRALLEGRKTQTRRIIKKPAAIDAVSIFGPRHLLLPGNIDLVGYAPGCRLWVREAFNAFQFSQDGDEAWPVKIPTLEERKEANDLGHRYDAPQIVHKESDRARKWFSDQKWRPSIHMPRFASRLTLIVSDVRVQRLQDISAADSIAEGMQCATCKEMGQSACNDRGCFASIGAFCTIWNSLHGPEAWDANPWVCALTFTVHRCNIDQMEAVNG